MGRIYEERYPQRFDELIFLDIQYESALSLMGPRQKGILDNHEFVHDFSTPFFREGVFVFLRRKFRL